MFEFDQSLWVYALLIFVGFIAGFMNTMAGGGSLLTLPLLIFLGLPAAVANGTNRVAILMSTSSATLGFKSKNVSTYPFNIYLGISGLFGALIGAKLAIEINGDLFNKILAVIMIVVVGLIVFKPKINHNNLIERLTGKHLFISILAFFFIGVYGFITRKNLISILMSVELILNASVINFVVINKYLYPDMLQGVFFSIFIIAVAAAETALAISIIINLYRQIASVEVEDTEIMKY